MIATFVLVSFCVFPSVNHGALGQELSAWKEILSFRPPTSIQKSVQARGKTWTVHRLGDGSGDVNLDYYPVRVKKLPKIDGVKVSAPELLTYFRTNINKFVDNDLTTFEPYKNQDQKLWDSSDPSGAMLFLNIKLMPGVSDMALVVCSQDSSNEFIFSTVRGGSGYKAINNRNNPGAHPVSGNRGFGFYKNEDEYTFYTIGADRATRAMDEFWGIPKAKEIGFKMGDKLWKSYQRKLASFVNSNEGIAIVATETTSSKRYKWESIKTNKQVFNPSVQPKWAPVPE